ncbi:MAG: YraN family protein [Ktedonobacterales bacterium]
MDARGDKQARRDTSNARDGRKRLGGGGERLAATWLEARGYRIIARNWRCPYGELDLVAENAAQATSASATGELVFVEVKTRRGVAMGAPEEAITQAKRRHLIAAAQCYLAERGEEARAYRIDVIAVDLTTTGTLREVRHYPRCIEAEE